MPNISEHKKFLCCDSRTNHNKLWQYTLFDNDDLLVSWGRVGKALQEKTHIRAGKWKAEKLIGEKLKKGYKEVNILDADGKAGTNSKTLQHSELSKIATEQIDHTDPEVAKLIKYLVKVNRHDIYKATSGKVTWDTSKGLFTTPLGIVTPDTIKEARTILVKLGDYVDKKQYKASKFLDLLEEYLVLIPQDIGMKFNAEKILPSLQAVQQQGAILDSLEASYQAVMTQPTAKQTDDATQIPKLFDVKLHLVGEKKDEKRLFDLFYNTRKTQHTCYGYRPVKVYQVEMPTAKAEFEQSGKPLGNVMELFHGSDTANLLSVLKSSLKLRPPSSVRLTASMFSNGIYFANCATKSLNYSCGYWGGGSNSRIFMFIAQVAMGKYYIPSGPTSQRPPAGYDSYFAKAGKSGVLNDELVVFKEYQVNLTHLIEFSPR